MFLPNPGVLAAGAGGAKTYAEFVAHITTLAVNGVADWRYSPWFGTSASANRVLANWGVVGEMRGSPWGLSGAGGYVQKTWAGGESSTCRVIQHCLPSEAEFNNQVSNQRWIFYRSPAEVTRDVRSSAVTRNGFTSAATVSSGNIWSAGLISELIYWDGERAQRMQPSLGLGPEPYDW